MRLSPIRVSPGPGVDLCKAWLLVDWPPVFQGANYSRSLGRRALLLGGSMRKLKVHVKVQNILQTSEKKDLMVAYYLFIPEIDILLIVYNVLIILGVH